MFLYSHFLTVFFSKKIQKCKKIRHFSKKNETIIDFALQKIVIKVSFAVNLHQ